MKLIANCSSARNLASFSFGILISSLLLGCDDSSKNSAGQKPLTESQREALLEKTKLHFTSPVWLEGSDYVLYPLQLKRDDEEDYIIGDYGSRGRAVFWNIAFYAPATGEYHLLDESRKIVIYSFGSSSGTSGYEGVNHSQPVAADDSLLYYSIVSLDYNKDGALNPKDPTYLFVSDRAGRNFRQISPDGFDVIDWRRLPGTTKVSIMGRRDDNADSRFNSDDETTPLVFDLRQKGFAQKIFDDDFTTKTKKLLNQHRPMVDED